MFWFNVWEVRHGRPVNAGQSHEKVLNEAVRLNSQGFADQENQSQILAEWDICLRDLDGVIPVRDPGTVGDPLADLADLSRIMAAFQPVREQEIRLILLTRRRPEVVFNFHAQFFLLLMSFLIAPVACEPQLMARIQVYHQDLTLLEMKVLRTTIKAGLTSNELAGVATEIYNSWLDQYIVASDLYHAATKQLSDPMAAAALSTMRRIHSAMRTFLVETKIEIPNPKDYRDPADTSAVRMAVSAQSRTVAPVNALVWILDLAGSSSGRDDFIDALRNYHAMVYESAQMGVDGAHLMAVNTWGDGAIAVFSHPIAGLKAQHHLIKRFGVLCPAWSLRGGVAFGSVLCFPNQVIGQDVTGDAVIMAARLEPCVPKGFTVAFHASVTPELLAATPFAASPLRQVLLKPHKPFTSYGENFTDDTPIQTRLWSAGS